MRIHVLGSAAGGGFPQWNCGCANCAGVRAGTIAAIPRTQASVAIFSGDGSWFLVHASPDVRTQLSSFPPLHPRALRDSPIAGIVLTNGDLDQCLGLLSLRESQPLHVYATDTVRRTFMEGNRLSRSLNRTPGQMTWHELKPETSRHLLVEDGGPSSLVVTAVPVPGKVPLYVEGDVDSQAGENIALLFSEREGGPVLGYAPCVGGMSASVERILDRADCLFFDGTFWSEEELVALGASERTAYDMAHWPLADSHGSLSLLAKARASRRILIHINNTNPILREDSLERRQTEQAGLEVAYDGMEVAL